MRYIHKTIQRLTGVLTISRINAVYLANWKLIWYLRLTWTLDGRNWMYTLIMSIKALWIREMHIYCYHISKFSSSVCLEAWHKSFYFFFRGKQNSNCCFFCIPESSGQCWWLVQRSALLLELMNCHSDFSNSFQKRKQKVKTQNMLIIFLAVRFFFLLFPLG